MTLFRQLMLFFAMLLALVLVVGWLASLDTVRWLLAGELQARTQANATSLAAGLAWPLTPRQEAAFNSRIDRVFEDGGDYSIALVDATGRPRVEREPGPQGRDVPAWFVHLMPLPAAIASRLITDGDAVAATLKVRGNPSAGYKALWQTGLHLLTWFGGVGLALTVLTGLGLRILLRPLSRLERQADAICRQDYEAAGKSPRPRELRRVFEAMNDLTLRLQRQFEKQAQEAERLQQQSYRDPVSGLGNRSYFDAHLRSLLAEQTQGVKGALLLVRLQHLKEVNDVEGFEAGDALLQKIADVLDQVTMEHPSRILARLSGGDFGLLMPEFSVDEAEGLAQRLCDTLTQLHDLENQSFPEFAVVGVAVYTRHTDASSLMGAADAALAAARSQKPVGWRRAEEGVPGPLDGLGRRDWRDLLTQTLEQRDLVLYVQPVVAANQVDAVIQLEILARLQRPDGSLWAAAAFMPMAERLGLAGELDQLVLEKVFEAYPAYASAPAVAVNLSAEALRDPTFLQWLLEKLAALPPQGPRLELEFAEFAAVAELDVLRVLRRQVQEIGHGVGLDHFGQSFSNFGYLQSLRPDYVKIDQAYTDKLAQADGDDRFFVSSLCNVARSLEIAVIAEGVEEQSQLAVLRELNIRGVQGFLTGPPAPAGATPVE